MDECLGSFMSLWAFCELIPKRFRAEEKSAFLEAVADRVANSSRLWVFRPGLDSLWKALAQAHHQGLIAGCFILSNNGSPDLVELIRRTVNIKVRQFSATPGRPLFVAGWHRYSPCRGGKTVKDFDQIQRCLASEGLPTMNSPNDLLFYDDLAHVLHKQIPHYVQVQPYFNYTPIHLVQLELSPIMTKFNVPPQTVSAVMNEGLKTEADDMKNDPEMIPYPPTRETAGQSKDMFLGELRNFLQESRRTVALKSRTRRRTAASKAVSKTRKTVSRLTRSTTTRPTTKPITRPATKPSTRPITRPKSATANINTLFRKY
jgi:hypothetical protein